MVIFNSPLTSHRLGAIIATPHFEAHGSGSFGCGPPETVVIPKGSFAILRAGTLASYNLSVAPAGTTDASSSLLTPLTSTYALRKFMNDANQQTANADFSSGAVFYRTFDINTRQEVFVFGRFNNMTGEGSGIGALGTYLYQAPCVGWTLSWTNCSNRPDPGLAHPEPPGFVMAVPGCGSGSGSGSA